VVTEIKGEDGVNAVVLKNVDSGETTLLPTDGVFIFIGHTPNTEIFSGQLALDDQGYVEVNKNMETSVPGVFAAGEVADPDYRQVITSAGMGAAAAIQATRYLENKEY
jgi:thioredoxin reductase (NADPH)